MAGRLSGPGTGGPRFNLNLRLRLSFHLQSKVVICGRCLVTLSLTT